MSGSQKTLTSKELQSKGGKARASKLTPERRKEIASLAGSSRKINKQLPKATHSGDLYIGDTKISCAVLEDGRRLITETSMYEILGKTRGGREKGASLPRFLTGNNLKPLISRDLINGQSIIEFRGKTNRKSYGYDANLIPEICKLFLDARNLNLLNPSQQQIALKSEIILHSLAKVGINSLIDEATGYQLHRENDELQKLFSRFIAQELQPWTKRFPNEYFDNIKRMYGLEHLKGNPKFTGHLINKYIYSEISPEILEELKRQNPITNQGHRRHCHHQLLTDDVGHPALERQIIKINTLMKASDNKEEFEFLFEKSKR